MATLGVLGMASAASAASFTVNDPADAALANSANTACVSSDTGGTCTLRAAVQAADNAGAANTITIPAGIFKLTIADPTSASTDNPAVGDLDVNHAVQLTITGAGANSTVIDANHIDRAFAVQSGGTLSISGVTIENGSQPNASPSSFSISQGNGGAIYNDGALSIAGSVLTGSSASAFGGAVFADTGAASTSITTSLVTGNTAQIGGGVLYASSGTVTFATDTMSQNSSGGRGGALYDDESGNTVGAVAISATTISSNVSNGPGGALYLLSAGTLNVSASTLNNNTSGGANGGAIYDTASGTMLVSGSTLSDNSSGDSSGGAIYASATGVLTVNGSTFASDNSGNSPGGALYLLNTDVALAGSTFVGDEASQGGAVYLIGSSATAAESITTTTFSGNHANSAQGGAVDVAVGALSVSRSTFTGNQSANYAGALYYGSSDGLALTNDTLDGNQATEGGAIYFNGGVSSGTISLLNDTITRNSAYFGGGIAEPQDATSIENTIVANNSGGNTSSGGGDCYSASITDNAAAADKGGNIDGDGTCFTNSTTNDHTDVNPLLGPLAASGGPTATDALLSGSPAIGDAVAGSCPSTDQRGVPRPSACDSGAFQTAGADLAITVSAPATGTVGSPLIYTLTVANNGPGSATGVTITDPLPGGTTYFSSSASQGSCSGTAAVTCSLGTLDSVNTGMATSATVTIVVIPSVKGTLTDFATVGSSTSDPNLANNTAAGSTAVGGGPTVTAFVAPVVLTGVASQITTSKAKLSAIINPAGQLTTYFFQYGTSKSYGKVLGGKALVASTTPSGVVVSLKGLKSGKTYHFRIVATNASGTSYGKDASFKTKKAAKKKKKKKQKKK